MSALRFTIAAFAVAAVAAAAAPAAGAKLLERPPKPVVVSADGDKKRAARGSYCWHTRAVGVCADTIDPLEFAPTLRVRRRSSQVVRTRIPVENLSASDKRGRKVRVKPIGNGNRKFRIKPRWKRAKRVGVYLFATYDRRSGKGIRGGDLLAAIWLKAGGRNR